MSNVTAPLVEGCAPGIPNCYNGINISAFSCDKEKIGDIYALSRYCYYATELNSTQCFPAKFFAEDTSNYNVQLFATLWMLFVGTIGVVGNLLTILAIPYNMAMKKLIKILIVYLKKFFYEIES